MYRGAGFRILSALLALAGLVALGALAYGAGYSAGSVDGTAHPAGWAYGGFFGWHVLGFIFGLFVLFLVIRLVVFAVFGYRHWHWDGYPGPVPGGPSTGLGGGDAPYAAWGPGPWHRGPRHYRRYVAAQAWFDEFHARSHGADAGPVAGAAPGADGSGTSPGGPGATGGTGATGAGA